ncbi:single-stranded-DNA-specific exonuclease RecJ [Candidatus Roizmanbacteria bacterium CG03_land_8_20_14_0_80_39_12]|uniref:Single-stranded-DNA-specific exonuclease RecJ n=1 Tax=Candidatus Roizmanbacteria bacterium CG03_land_8_20_14_0_80_39_12 TaxID=1974847 RepID=A0A2M7BSX3_9BACT|nr:MAG: single-stranded-DNA-specific exonuclease RecJ [Candidatus Roizmanbacteria bacterium CG03_land_8_20_14_0_80_39_12]
MTPDQIIAQLLSKRKIENVTLFLKPPHPLTFSLLSLGFEKELNILFQKLQSCKDKNETVVVYTDYDADGITGGSILWETLHAVGFKVFPYVPHRQSEGYGFSVKGIDAVIEKYHPKLIISVDHGISAREQVKYASDKGISVIITDHHTKPKLLPTSAKAIIHCPLVSGSGLAYITALDIWHHFDAHNETLKQLFTTDFLALASLGTIADLVPLTGYSRSIAKYGLRAFSKATKPGIKELLAVSGLSHMEISTYHAGFALAPRINAVGRLSHAIEAVRMLCTKDAVKAKLLAQEAQAHNTTRQKMVDLAVEEAFIAIEKTAVPKLILQKKENWNEGIIGLISSKITERYQRPSIVMTKTEEGWKGSARSVKGFDITAFLRSLKLLKHIGGHPQAGGFSLTDDQLDEFEKQINLHMKEVPEPKEWELYVDMDISLSCVSEKLVDALQELTPFGIGNPTPVFQSSIKVLFVKSMGKKQEHLKFVGQDPVERTKQLECVYFSPSDEQKKLIKIGSTISIAYTVDSQYWQGKRQLKCFIKVVS